MSARTANRYGLTAGCLAAALGILVTANAWAERAEKPSVMVLGTFHFRGSASDEISVTMGDVMSARRQAEIEKLADRLESFEPTKIAVEVAPEHETMFNERYRKYKSGNFELTAGESEQIGMRLAKRLGHDRLYAVDHQQDMDMQHAFSVAEAAGQSAEIAVVQKRLGEIESALKQAQSPKRTILDALRFHNGPLLETGNQLYLTMALLGSGDNPAGAEVVGGWYERNLKIYANIARLAEGPEDRILVIFGSGHAPHLTSFFDQNPDFELVPAMSVLGE